MILFTVGFLVGGWFGIIIAALVMATKSNGE